MSAAASLSSTPSTTSSFFRPCWLEVHEGALRANWRALRSQLAPDVQMLAVVKANGYGLGILSVAKVAVEEGAAYLGVSSVEEGIQLRKAGFQVPVLILGSLFPFESFAPLFDYRLTPTVASLEAAQALDRMATQKGRSLPVHLKIDTGFGRIGVSTLNALGFITQVAAMRGLELEGLYTHFASSDVDPVYTREQASAFRSVIQAAREAGISPRWVHMANSSAMLRFAETHGNLVRPGIAFYGVDPFLGASQKISLKQAMTWKSRIIFLKTVPAGSSISYARTWTARRKTLVATLAVGYADGLPRLLSNKGQVLLQGRRAPVLGRVTMDMTMVDVTDIDPCRVGDEVVLLGTQGTQTITALEMAEWAQTNAYEILCGLADRVPRVMTHE